MKLSDRQQQFSRMVAALINKATELGYGLTFGDAYAVSGHCRESYHYLRLAVDFNLFIDGIYQTSTEAHRPLGEYWKSLNGTWGGDFKKPDGNHYSFGEGER